MTGVTGYLAPTMSWFLLTSMASWEKSFTPGNENSNIHILRAGNWNTKEGMLSRKSEEEKNI